MTEKERKEVEKLNGIINYWQGVADACLARGDAKGYMVYSKMAGEFRRDKAKITIGLNV